MTHASEAGGGRSGIQINSYNAYLVDVPPNAERDKARGALMQKMRNMDDLTPAPRALFEVARGMKEINRYPEPRAGSTSARPPAPWTWWGPSMSAWAAGRAHGMEDITSIPKITERLVKLGYTEPAGRLLGRQCIAGAGST